VVNKATDVAHSISINHNAAVKIDTVVMSLTGVFLHHPTFELRLTHHLTTVLYDECSYATTTSFVTTTTDRYYNYYNYHNKSDETALRDCKPMSRHLTSTESDLDSNPDVCRIDPTPDVCRIDPTCCDISHFTECHENHPVTV